MTDFDIMRSNLNGAQGGAPSSGFDIIGPNAGGRPLYGQPQNGAGQPVPQQQGAPVSGLMAGMLGLPTYGGAIPGATYLTPGQVQQPQQGNGLLAGMTSVGQPGNLAGAAAPAPQAVQQQQMGSQQGGQPQNIGSSIGGLLGQMIYGAQSRDV